MSVPKFQDLPFEKEEPEEKSMRRIAERREFEKMLPVLKPKKRSLKEELEAKGRAYLADAPARKADVEKFGRFLGGIYSGLTREKSGRKARKKSGKFRRS